MGKLLAVEGPDLVGKSTLLRDLQQEFERRGFSVAMFRFPPDDRSEEVELLYEVFTRSDDPMQRQITLVQMFNAYGPKLLAALREHDLVLIDRYILSTLVACRALEMDPKPVLEALRSAIIPPDVTIIYTGKPFKEPEYSTERRRKYRETVTKTFEGDLPEYRYPIVRVTNQAGHEGRFEAFVSDLADELLGRLNRPTRKVQESDA